jgi:hypothetical protein
MLERAVEPGSYMASTTRPPRRESTAAGRDDWAFDIPDGRLLDRAAAGRADRLPSLWDGVQAGDKLRAPQATVSSIVSSACCAAHKGRAWSWCRTGPTLPTSDARRGRQVPRYRRTLRCSRPRMAVTSEARSAPPAAICLRQARELRVDLSELRVTSFAWACDDLGCGINRARASSIARSTTSGFKTSCSIAPSTGRLATSIGSSRVLAQMARPRRCRVMQP